MISVARSTVTVVAEWAIYGRPPPLATNRFAVTTRFAVNRAGPVASCDAALRCYDS